MDIRPIRTEGDYAVALDEVARLMEIDPAEGTADYDRMDVLATLVEAYEARVHPIEAPNPVEAILTRMQDKDITRRSLCSVTGISESKLSEVLNYKRPLSLNMIRTIGPVLDLPLDLLVQPYPVTNRVPVGA